MAGLDPRDPPLATAPPETPPSEGPSHVSRFPAGSDRRLLATEVGIVLALSLLPAAVDAIISLASAPLAGIQVFTFSNAQLAQQLSDIVFTTAPVALVFYLIRRNGEPRDAFGFQTDALARDAAWGLLAAMAVSAVGIAIYLAAIRLDVNRFVVPVPPLGHWWTVPVLVLGAAESGLLEEVIVAGYLIRRLEQFGLGSAAAVVTAAVFRGAYHLYQGWGGFTGNLLLGLAFGTAFVKWRRTWPLVVAHVAVDTLAGVAYIVFRGHCIFGACIK
jgi:membrane protease YdiL (CAAX protease family)